MEIIIIMGVAVVSFGIISFVVVFVDAVDAAVVEEMVGVMMGVPFTGNGRIRHHYYEK